MAKAKRNVGLEILRGIREIKRGEHGRVITVPSVASVRESTGCRNRSSRGCWASRSVRSRSGSRGAGRPREQRERFSSSRRRIRARFARSPKSFLALTTTTLKGDAYAFFFDQSGLMAGLGLQGTKITKVNP